MSNKFVFDGEQTIDDLVDALMELVRDGDGDDVLACCELVGEHVGYVMEVTIRRDERFDA